MARSQEDIFSAMKQSVSESLPQLNNASRTAIWQLIMWICAAGIAQLERIFDAFRVEVDALAASAQVGNSMWYRRQILAFQFGDNLVLQGDKYVYADIDFEKQIIAKCAIEERNDGSIRIKVAKSLNGALVSLDANEIAALISYVKKIRFAGVRFSIFSNNGDILKVGASIYYDPIVTVETVKHEVTTIIKTYIQNLPFNGELQLSKLTDAIQKIEGVKDVVLHEVASKFSMQDMYVAIERTTIAVGGYFNISPTQGETLDETVNYIAI